ncbi:MAG: TonB-dependent receptor [Deltaproteobacteria bacterium]|nr:TonB-dependent receptor [Deltaproteobacteria bacterium]
MLLPLLTIPLALTAPPDPVNPYEEPDESELFELDEQIVTVASKYEQTLRKAPGIITLVTAEQIRERGYRTLSELLRDLPGIYVWKSHEGRDIATFRGIVSADNNKILLLIDGIPWYDGVYTHAFVDDFLPISHVKQVEVIKGPGSAIYGTNAFAGVLNVVTWDASDLDGGRVRWVAGSRGRSDLTGTVGGHTRTGGLDMSAVAYVRLLSQLGDGLDITPRGRRDIQGQDQKTGVNVGGRVELEGLALQLHHVDYRHSFLISEVDDPNDALAKDPDAFGLYYHNTFFHGRYTWDVTRDLAITPYGWSHRHDNPGSYWFHQGYETIEVGPDEFETIEHFTTVETEKDTRRWGAGVDFSARPGLNHITVAGLGLENVVVVGDENNPGIIDREYVDGAHEHEETEFAGSGKLRNLFLYLQHAWTPLPELELTAGGRVDMRVPANDGDDPNAEVFKPSITPRLGLLLVPSEHLTMKLLYGQAFRQPNVRETLVLAAVDDETGDYKFASGNLEIRAERIDTVEGEATWTPVPPVTLRIDGYYSVLHNEIDKVTPPNEYQNLPGTLAITGGEAEARGEVSILEFGGTYALTVARYSTDAGPYADRLQYEFPPHMAKAFLQVNPTSHLTGVVWGEAYSYRPRVEWGPNVGRRDGEWFALLHAGVRVHDLGKHERFDVHITLRNLTDTKWGTGIYRDDANAGSQGVARYPEEIEGEERSVTVGIETVF